MLEYEKLKQQGEVYSQIIKHQLYCATIEVPHDIALEICRDIRQEEIHSSCLQCMQHGKNNIPARFVESATGYSGCCNVGQRYINSET